jgi:hypothetical protein
LEKFRRDIPDPSKATAQQIDKLLHHAYYELDIRDFMNTDSSKIPSFEVRSLHPSDPNAGIFVRHSEESRFALLGVGQGSFAGPASSPQEFAGTVVAVRNADRTWLVQSDEFRRTYTHPDGRRIALDDLPAFEMRPGVNPVAAEPKVVEVAEAIHKIVPYMQDGRNSILNGPIKQSDLKRQSDRVEVMGHLIARMPEGIYDPKAGYGVSVPEERITILPGTICFGNEVPQRGRPGNPASFITVVSPRDPRHKDFVTVLDNRDIVAHLLAPESPTIIGGTLGLARPASPNSRKPV